MNPLVSGSLMAASMLLGQTPGPPTLPPSGSTASGPIIIQQAQGGQTTMQPSSQRPVMNWFNRDDRPIITKIQSWFKRDPQAASNPQQAPFIQPTTNTKVREVPPPITSPAPSAAPGDFPRKLPNPSTQGNVQRTSVAKESTQSSKSVQQTTLQQSTPAPAAKTPILPQWTDKIGRDEKFEWVTGQLELEGGKHVIYYATPETVDKYHGRIVLAPQQVDMKSFRRGDLVSLRGQLGQSQLLPGATPIYRLTDATLIDRPKQ